MISRYSGGMSNAPLQYSVENEIAYVQMDDGKANALSEAMIDALVAALDKAKAEASALVLSGRPDRFCAGFDLRVMMTSPEAAKALLRRGADLLMRFYGAELPVVIACTGHALAGGALLALTGDVRIGADGPFRVGLNEVQIGMPVPVLAMELARDRLATKELAHATLGARIYSPREAVEAGYLDAVVAPGELAAKAKEEAKRLSALSRPAYAATKQRLRGKTIAHVLETLEADMASLLPGNA